MKRLLTSILWIAAVSVAAWATGVAATPAQPVKLSAAAAATVLKEIEKDRTDTQKWLQSDSTSYLATIDRRDFDQKKVLTVGRAVDNDVRIEDPAFAAHHLKVTVDGDAFHVVAVDQDARFKIPGDKDAKTWQEKRDATVEPSSVQVGRFLLRLSHQRFPAIIVFDPQSPRFKLYKGLKYFPPDLSYRYELALTPNPKPETTIIMSTRGNQRRADKVGWFDFVVGSTPVRLEAVRLLEPGVGENDLGIFFHDATTGKESYELGRYVDVKKLPNGKFRLDFNFTYNPACAYSDHYNCPIPPKANVLPIAIRAGEMDAHYH